MARKIEIQILGDASNLEHAFGQAGNAANGFGSHLTKLKLAAGVAGAAMGGILVEGLKGSVDAAMAGQASQAALDTALKTTQQSVAGMKPVLDAAEASSRKLGFADNESRAALARLELASKSTKSAISDLSVAEGIARLKHIDLASAANMLIQAHTGSQRAAKALGVVIQPLTNHYDALKEKYKELGQQVPTAEAAQAKFLDKMATGQSIIAAVTDKVKGQADAYSQTAAGGLAQFHAESEHLQETLGKTLLPVLTAISEKLATLMDWFVQHKTIAEALVIAFGVVAGTLLAVSASTAIVSASTAIATAATGAWTGAQWLLNAALDANPIALVIIALVAIGAALYVAWTKSQTFRDIVTGVWDDVKGVVHTVTSFFTTTVPDAFTTVLNWVRGHWPEIATIISGPFAPIVALATNAFGVRDALTGAFGDIKTYVSGAISDIVGWFSGLPGRIEGFATAIGSGFVSALEKGLSALGDMLKRVIEAPFNAIIDAWNSIGFDIKLPSVDTHIPGVGRVGGGELSFHVPQLPHLDTGGYIEQSGIAVVHKGETVVPAGRGGGLSLQITFGGPVYGDKRKVAQELVDEIWLALQEKGRLRGGLALP